MKDYKMQTPEGVRDYCDSEMIIKDEIASRLKKLYQSYGYNLIETPSFEYLDVFNEESIQNTNIYSFVNRNGEILALRSDMTKSISRVIASKPYKRLCYQSNIFRYTTQYHGMQNEFTQCGIELIDDGVKADAEVIRLAVMSLKQIEAKNFTIHIGDTTFVKSIIDNLKNPKRAYEAIKRCDGVMLEEVLTESNEGDLVDIVLELTSRVGKIDLLKRLQEIFPNNETLNNLERIYNYLGEYQEYIYFDFSLISYGDYYNGVRFQGFVKGVGEAVLNGGRYITKKSSIGFGININQLIDRVNLKVRKKTAVIGYLDEYVNEAYKMADKLIEDNYVVCMSKASRLDEINETADLVVFVDKEVM